MIGPDGALGVCCPMDAPSCNCTQLGGWGLAGDGGCTRSVCDAWPDDFERQVDEWGCPYWTHADPFEETGCCLCFGDAGAP